MIIYKKKHIIRYLIAWKENNNYLFKRNASTRSDLNSILRIKNRVPNSDVYPTLRDLTMKTEGSVGRGIILGKAATCVCAVRANSAYTCMYVSGGHGF